MKSRLYSRGSMPSCRLWRRLLLGWLAVVALGCAPNIDHLVRHHQKGEFKTALTAAKGDPELELALALLIVENAAAREQDAFQMVDVLKQAKRPGKRFLERLAKSGTVAGRLARIASADVDEPPPELLTLCRADDYGDVRTACMRAFYPVMEAASLEKGLLDTDPRVRRYAIKGLVKGGASAERARLLGEALRLDPDAKVRAEAASAGPLLGDDALYLLKNALEDDNKGVRFSAIKGIALLKTDVGNKQLEEMVLRKTDLMSVVAAVELARLGIPLGREHLDAALKDSRPTIRKAALLRLERADLSDRFDRIFKMLNDESPEVVLLAASLLRKHLIYRPGVIEALRTLSEKASASKTEARDRLAVMGDEKAVAEVSAALKEADTETLLRIIPRIQGAEGLRDEIVNLMGDGRIQVREQAAQFVISCSQER